MPTTALVPLLVTKHFGKGAIELGLLESSMGIGIIAGGILLSIWGGFKKKIATSLVGIIGLGIGVTLTGLAPANLFILAIVGNVILGSMIPIANGPIGALMQSIVRPDMQGRVMSLVNSGARVGWRPTATTTCGNNAAARSTRSRCPFVGGSKLPA